MIHWFFDSLHSQCGGNYDGINLVIVDFHADDDGRKEDFASKFRGPKEKLKHVTPKPTVWQGKHRLTKQNWFAAANARNTALCLAPDGHICYVDDLSVLMPGWYNAMLEGVARGGLTFGAYRKVKELTVEPETGVVTHHVDHPPGADTRIGGNGPVGCGGRWLYGSSLVGPVESFLITGGWPEALCDSLSFEDCVMGKMLETHRVPMCYDRRMMTWESEEHHFIGERMRREDYGKSPNDKSHKVLELSNGLKYHPNYFGDEGIRGLRARVLSGEPFPVMTVPENEWYTGKFLRDL